MDKKSLFFHAALAGILVTGSSSIASDGKAKAASGHGAHHGHCMHGNDCKGKSQCGTADGAHSCKGHNDCKGKGWVDLSKKDCLALKAKHPNVSWTKK